MIRVEAVSIEGGDTLNRPGGALITNPHIVGYQAAGEIVEVGSEVKDLKVGQKVATTGVRLARRAARGAARTAWQIPDGLRREARRRCPCRSAPPTTACSSSAT